MKLKRAKAGKKFPPTPGFELQVTRCLAEETLSSPPGGWEDGFLSLKPKVSLVTHSVSRKFCLIRIFFKVTTWWMG